MRIVATLCLLAAASGASATLPVRQYCSEDICLQRVFLQRGVLVKDVQTFQAGDGSEHRVLRFEDGSVVSIHISHQPNGTCKRSYARVLEVASGLAAGQGCLQSENGMTDVALKIVVRAADLNPDVLLSQNGLTLWRTGVDPQWKYHAFASDPVSLRVDEHPYLPRQLP